MRFADVAYFYNRTDKPEQLLEAHRANLGYFDFLPAHWQRTLVKFADGKGHITGASFEYRYFQGHPSRLWIPLEANTFMAGLRPDMVLVHGLIFPQQLIMLRSRLGKSAKIMVQHHGELPGQGIMRGLQCIADKYVDAYLFAARDLAVPWIKDGIIGQEKVHEVMEGSVDPVEIDKHTAREYLKLPPGPMFLWVGRLNQNKDPLTVLRGFAKYAKHEPLAKLYMVFQENDLLNEVRELISSDELLGASVVLVGKKDKKELMYWYNAADFYISGSHREGSGYALIEAMSCGCVPVVTDIPSFRKITAGTGLLYQSGDPDPLLAALHQAHALQLNEMSSKVKEQFKHELSFKAIAEQITSVCQRIGCNVSAIDGKTLRVVT